MKNNIPILHIAVQTPLRRLFDYLSMNEHGPIDCQIGQRVKVSFGRRTMVGIIIDISTHSELPKEKLKPIVERIDEIPLLDSLQLKLYQWASDYYHHSLGDVILGTLPKRLKQGKIIAKSTLAARTTQAETVTFQLTEEQKIAIDGMVNTTHFHCFLLAGVTGSGKTEVYMRVIEHCLLRQQQALVLVPEIALTPQTVMRFASRFDVPVLLLHSGLTDRVRVNTWMQANQQQPCIVIGTRSAVFAPLKNLGVIVIDEEHDVSFKQQSGFRYSARDVAVMRAKLANIPIILGSGTPSLESWYNVKQKKYTLFQLSKRPGNANLPTVILHDLRNVSLKNGLSQQLLKTMQAHLDQSNQVLLFLNRRGYAPVLICHHCGWTADCPHCDVKLTVHYQPKRLLCHHCGFQKKTCTVCESCQQAEVMILGVGTEQLENTLKSEFPHKTILRVDRDTMRSFSELEKALTKIRQNEADIIIGTQMLIKGHHFENVTLVAGIDVDRGLFSSDFRATERLGQSLIQVAGRAGRAEKKGEVFIQTHQPHHPYFKMIAKQNYFALADTILQERIQTQLPPKTHLVILRAEGKEKQKVMKFLETAKNQLISNVRTLEISDPLPPMIERKAAHYRAQILIQSSNRAILKESVTTWLNRIHELKQVRWWVDVDPVEL